MLVLGSSELSVGRLRVSHQVWRATDPILRRAAHGRQYRCNIPLIVPRGTNVAAHNLPRKAPGTVLRHRGAGDDDTQTKHCRNAQGANREPATFG
jgi:hypothetical protein